MTYEEAVSYIEAQTWSKTRTGLKRTEELLFKLGNPQDNLKYVHVAGTNGKGSTSVMTAEILKEAGYRVGFYPSPHIFDFRERISVNGTWISENDLARLTEKVKAVADTMEDDSPSQFEIVTAIGMLYFCEKSCDIVVLEVGMGGTKDSTNVIKHPEVCAITNIGLDHTEYLGDTIEEIAFAKGGIIKTGADVVCYDSCSKAVDVIKNISKEKGCRFILSKGNGMIPVSHSLSSQKFIWNNREYILSLLGKNQLKNAELVLNIIAALKDRGFDIPDRAVEKGFMNVRWPARFEVLSKDPVFILDGGHNPQCAQAFFENVREYLPDKKIVLLIGMLKDKDYTGTLDIISPLVSDCVCITPESPRALSREEMAKEMERRGVRAECIKDKSNDEGKDPSVDMLTEAVKTALRIGKEKNLPVCAFGSLYSAGSITKVFNKIKDQSKA